MKKTKLQKAVKTLRKALKKDPEFFYAYQANIAVQFMDEYNRVLRKKYFGYINKEDIHEISNNAAKSFLELLMKK